MKMAYSTKLGRFFVGDAEKELQSSQLKRYIGKVNLIFTSPPFALNTKKSYGNREGEAYIDWIAEFAPRLREFLTPDGSIVMEIGNSWEPGLVGDPNVPYALVRQGWESPMIAMMWQK